MRAPLAFAAALLGALAVGQAAPQNKAKGVKAFETVKKVLQHPRCQSCHIAGDAPLQLDEQRPHSMNVQRGPDGKGAPGLGCATCHGAANPPASYGAHTPPGAPNWRLPRPENKLIFQGLSAGELCKVVRDGSNMTMESLITHVSEDKLVLWGWSPGAGRAPVPVPHAEFVAKFKEWAEAGAPCAGE
jgi:hypothetical protein